MRLTSLVRSALCAVLGAALASAQEADDPLCGSCHTTGHIDNPRAMAKDSREAAVVYCSVAMDKDSKGLGLDWLVCEHCRAPAVQANAEREFEVLHGKRQKWLAERRKEVDELVGHPVDHLLTRHFTIAWDIPSIKVERRVVNRHEAMHLYAERMEALFQEIMELHGIDERRAPGNVHFLYLFEREKDARTAAATLTGSGSGARSSKYGKQSRMVTFLDKQRYKKDELFHQFLSHVVSHHIHNDVELMQNWLVERYGWVFEGLAHYVEIRNFGPPIAWCQREAGSDVVHWKSNGWEANVKRAVLAGEQTPLADLIGKQAEQLTAKEHQFAWSYIDYLMWLDPKKMPRLLGLMKGPQVADRDALEKVYSMSVPQFQAGWEQFVRDEYSPQKKDGPQPRAPKG